MKELIKGIKKTTSISNTKNKIAIIKKWIENGKREDINGSNPHSKEEIFSRSKSCFLEIKKFKKTKTIEIINTKIIKKKLSKINYINE